MPIFSSKRLRIVRKRFFLYCDIQHNTDYVTSYGRTLMKSSWFNKKRILLITVSVVIIVALCVGIFALKDNMSSNSPKDGSNITVSSAEDAATQLKELGDDIGYENALSELTEKSTTTIDGDTYYRLQQNYQGIPVYGRTVVCVTDEDGNTTAITGNVMDVGGNIRLEATISYEQIEESVYSYFENTLGYTEITAMDIPMPDENYLCIYNSEANGTSCLAYNIHIIIINATEVGAFETIIDANSAEILLVNSQLKYDTEVTIDLQGQEQLYEDVRCAVEDGTYKLNDLQFGIGACLAINKMTLFDFLTDFKAQHYNGAEAVIWNQKSSPDEAAVDAYVNTQISYHFFDKVLGNKSTDGKGEAVIAVLTGLIQKDGVDWTNNAYSRSSHSDGSKVTVLGFGIGEDNGITLSAYLDTVAHEYMHGVETFHSNMTYSGESGAIMEALSDIFGEIVESWNKENNGLVQASPDWIHNIGRNLNNPEKSGNPWAYKGKNWYSGSQDNGGVHINSTVISHAAYLMSKDGGGLLSMDELAKLWYRAMLMMPSDCDFAECRTLVELAAVSMGLSDAQIACVKEAFDTVGINNSETVDYELSSTATLSVYGADTNLYSDYTMQIAGTQTIWNQDADPTTDDIYNYYIYFRQNTTTEKYYETRHIITAEPVSLDLKYGVYTITLIDDEGGGTPVSFRIKVGRQNGKDNLDIYTNFVVGNSKQETTPGTNTTEPDTNGTEGNANKITCYIVSTRGFSDGVAWVEARQKENGVIVETQWACIDTSGNVLFMLDPNTFEPSSFANGVSLCKTYDSDYEVNAYNIIDKSGNIVFSSTDGSFDAVIAYSDGYFAVYTYTESFREAGYTVFFMNHKGEVTNQIDGLRTELPELINCGEGVFAEKTRQSAAGTVDYRFYDAKTGCQYAIGGIGYHTDISYIFHNGYAVIEGPRMGDTPRLVSTDGQITELKQFGYGSYYDFGPVSDGGFVCTSYYQDKVEWVKFYDISTGTLTRLGNYGERVALNRATGFRFDNGSMLLPLIGADGKNYYTIVDKSGQSLFDPVVCKYADAEGDNRILVKFEDKTVAYNGRGEMIFELPAGQSVDSYQDGVARLVGSDYAISNTYIDLYGKSLFDSDILLFKSKK